MSMKKNHMKKVLRKANKILDPIDLQLNDNGALVVNPEELNSLIESLNKLPLHSQKYTEVIELLEKVYRYEIISRTIKYIIANLYTQLPREQYEELKDMLRQDPILCEALREVESLTFKEDNYVDGREEQAHEPHKER